MSHDYHDALPGYHPDQILHDGCAECEYRGESVERAIVNLDQDRFEQAWRRASDCYRFDGELDRSTLSNAELPLLRALWALIVQLERRGVPTTEVPGETIYS